MTRYRTKCTDTQVVTLNGNDDAAFFVEVEFTITPGRPATAYLALVAFALAFFRGVGPN